MVDLFSRLLNNRQGLLLGESIILGVLFHYSFVYITFVMLTFNQLINRMKTYRFLGILWLFIFSGGTFAQQPGVSDLTHALSALEAEHYQEALPWFRKQVKAFPKDPMYHYYHGLCALHAGTVEEAQASLRYASTQQVPADVYLFLGRTYHKQYQFSKALDYYNRYMRAVTPAEAKRNRYLEVYRSQTENALYTLREFTRPEVLKREKFARENLFDTLPPMSQGKLVETLPMPVDSLLAAKLVQAFLPANLDIGDEVLLVLNDGGQQDLYRATLHAPDSLGIPEPLGQEVNTPFDEAYPVLSADGSTLFFASQGHYSMGDYDIYQSEWDWSEQKWHAPTASGFPVNSVGADFLFVPGEDPAVASFVSTRFCGADSVWYFQVQQSHKVIYRDVFFADSLLAVAALVPDAMKAPVAEGTVAKAASPAYTYSGEEGFLQKEAYDSLVQWAMVYQTRADSVQWLLADERDKLQEVAQRDQKQALMQSIVANERLAYQLQKKADQCYARVREIEQQNIARNPDMARAVAVQRDNPAKESSRASQVQVRIVRGDPLAENLQVEAPRRVVRPAPLTTDSSSMQVAQGLVVGASERYNHNRIPVDPTPNPKLVYRIQLGAFSRKLSPADVKGLYPVVGVSIPNRPITKYYAGEFFLLQEAKEALSKVHRSGFGDAFVVALKGGERMPVKEAVKIEQQELQGRQSEPAPDAEGTQLPGVRFVVRIPVPADNSELTAFLEDLTVTGKEKKWLTKEQTQYLEIGWYAEFEEALALKKKLAPQLPMPAEVHALTKSHDLPVK